MLSHPSKLVAKRFASAAAATSRGVQEKTSILNNGLSVSSIELNGATSSLVLAFRAGSRYQQASQQGLVNFIRNSIGRDSHEFPGLSLVWSTAANGGQINAVSNRDLLAVELNVVRDNVGVALSILGQLGTNAFKPWDVEDVKNETLSADATYISGTAIAFDDLHKAAFRNGPLGLSNIAVNNVSSNELSKFAAERLRSGDAVLVGVNVDHDLLLNTSQYFPLSEGSGRPTTQSKYFGGEVRKDGRGSQTHVAIAGEGAGLKSLKDVATQAVVAQILLNAATKISSETTSVNVNYQDAGLVGVQFAASNNEVASVTKSIVQAIKSANASTVEAAKSAAIFGVLSSSQKAANVALERASQLLAGAEATSPSQLAAAIKKVSGNDVTQFLSRVNGKLSLAVYGTPSLVPYLDEL